MPKLRASLALALLAALCLLSGCFDVTEEYHLRSDLSGEYKVTISMPESIATLGRFKPGQQSEGDTDRRFEDLKAELEKQPFVEEATVSNAAAGDSHNYVLDIQARDMRKLGEYLTQKAAEAGDKDQYRFGFKLERKGFGQFNFSRELKFESPLAGKTGAAPDSAPGSAPDSTSSDAAAAEAGGPNDLPGRLGREGHKLIDKGVEKGREMLGGLGGALGGLLGGAMFSEHYYTVRLYAPGITNTDATLMPEEKACEWRIPLADLAASSGPRVLSADFKALGISGSMLLLIALATMLFFGLLIGILVYNLSRRRKSGGSGPAPA